jgi:hypothetical protein
MIGERSLTKFGSSPPASIASNNAGCSCANLDSQNKYTGKTFAMSVFRMEKSLKEDFDDVKSGRYKGNLDVIKGDLEAVQKIKAIMIEKDIEWPPKQ